MAELGKLIMKDEVAVVDTARKIHALAKCLRFDDIGSIRLATITSELAKRLVQEKHHVSVSVSIEKLGKSKNNPPPNSSGYGLKLVFVSNSIDIPRGGAELFFDLLATKEEKNGSSLLEAVKTIPAIDFVPTAAVTKRAKEILRQVSKKELFREVQRKNTDLMAVLDELEGKNVELEAANNHKSLFLANMSHEIRTPMNAILGHAQIMMHDAKLNEKHRENLQIMDRSGKHLLGLINDILEMSKIEAGCVELAKNAFNLKRFLNDTLQMFMLSAQKKGLELRLEADLDPAEVIIQDQVKMRQILVNLLGNAMKFTQAGSIILRCQRLRTSSEGQTQPLLLSFEVEDTGKGIAQQEQDKIFGLFSQASEDSNAVGGTGLGLTISRRYAQLMEGTLALVASTPGKGSLFRVTIQAETAAVQDSVQTETIRPVRMLKPGQREFQILVAGNHDPSRDVIIQLLIKGGFQIHTANNGKDAVAMCQELKPDVVLMDIRMSGMDGEEAIRRIKVLPQGKDTVVFALDERGLEEQRDRIMALGASDFIKKPVEEGELFEMIRRHLGVEYSYADQGQQLDTGNLAAQTLVREDVVKLPASLRENLHKAALLGNIKQLKNLIDEVTLQEPELGAALSYKLRRYDLATLVALFK